MKCKGHPTDQTNTGDASVTITRNPDGTVKFEAVTQTDVPEKAVEGKDLRGAKIS